MKEDKYFYEKFIKINPFDFKNSIISHCRQMDKADVYEWIANDELKIHQLETNWKELEKRVENKKEKSRHGNDVLRFTAYEWVLNEMQELENKNENN